MRENFDSLLDKLRAVAEPSRLRLLAILAEGEFSVTELTQVLGQSQPRVSRHLKLLCDVGLLEKFREQHWVYYRAPVEGAGRDLVSGLLAQIDLDDPMLRADRERVETVLERRRAEGTAESAAARDGASDDDAAELVAVLAAELGDRGRGSLFHFGGAPAEVLAGLASRARRIVGMHPSRREIQRARATLHSRGVSHCVLQQGELRNLPFTAADFDVALIDRALAAQERPVEALREVGRLLQPGGELIVVEDYDALATDAAAQNPLATLRTWLVDAGLVCSRLHPCDVAGQHLLLAVAHVFASAATEAAVA